MKKIILLITVVCLVNMFFPNLIGGETRPVVPDFAIVSPECWLTSNDSILKIEYSLAEFRPEIPNQKVLLQVWLLNAPVFPVPDWCDKTYYLTQARFDKLFDNEFNSFVKKENELWETELKLPRAGNEKLTYQLNLEPRFDYLLQIIYVDNHGNRTQTGYKLVGGNWLELPKRSYVTAWAGKITKNSIDVFALPGDFDFAKKEMANVTLTVWENEKLIPNIVYQKGVSITIIADPAKKPHPWYKPDNVLFAVSNLLPDHEYKAQMAITISNGRIIVAKEFKTLK